MLQKDHNNILYIYCNKYKYVIMYNDLFYVLCSVLGTVDLGICHDIRDRIVITKIMKKYFKVLNNIIMYLNLKEM